MNIDDVLGSVNVPIKINFEPTMACNLRCPMCDRTQKDDYEKHRDNQLPYETVKAFLHEVGRLGTRYFLFIGGGEPTCDPHLEEYMRILKSYGVYLHLWTNGTLIDEEKAKWIAELCDMVTVSLDSPDPAVNDVGRGVKGATEKSIAGIRLLRANSDSLYLRIHSVISALNVGRLHDFADFAAENGVTEIAGALMAPFGFVPDDMRFSDGQVATLSQKLEDLCEYARSKGVALGCSYSGTTAKIIQNLTNIHNMYPTAGVEVPDKPITCLGLWSQVVVHPNGDVAVCCYTYKPVLGNLHEMSFEEIWHSERAEELRALVRRGEFLDGPCVGCDMGHQAFTKDLAVTGSLESFYDACIYGR